MRHGLGGQGGEGEGVQRQGSVCRAAHARRRPAAATSTASHALCARPHLQRQRQKGLQFAQAAGQAAALLKHVHCASANQGWLEPKRVSQPQEATPLSSSTSRRTWRKAVLLLLVLLLLALALLLPSSESSSPRAAAGDEGGAVLCSCSTPSTPTTAS